jgi:hypothetical protein
MKKFMPAALFVAFLVIAGCHDEPVREKEVVVIREKAPPSRGPADVVPGDPPPPEEDFGTEEEAAYFREYLEPHGSWIEVEEYGVCWQPHNVAPDWRPYFIGHWAFTDDYGWFWVSDEPFGWCCYHYGRWAFTTTFGWVWVPGRHWCAAWVCWRHGGGYVGWAPLPPVRQHIDINVEIESIPHWCFNFVEERYITDVRLRERIEPVTRNVTLVNVTKNITKYEFVNGRFVNRGVDVNYIEKITGKRVERFKVSEVNHVHEMGVRGNQIAVFRPHLPPRPAAQRTATAQRPPSRWVRTPAPSHAVAQVAQRRALMDPYHQRLEEAMLQRHQLERQRPPTGFAAPQMAAIHEREREAFARQRKRERESSERVPTYMGSR